jgi:hypothetical protein
MPESTGDPMISEERRREIYAALVEGRDPLTPVAESHAAICRQFGIDRHKLRDIEREGLSKTWPS